MGFCDINKELLPIKVHYFLLNGAHAGVIPFIPVYGEQLGISASAIGIVLAVLSCLMVVTKTAFGGITDYFQKLKQVVVFLILVDIVADLGLNFIPKPQQKSFNASNTNIICYENMSYAVDFDDVSCMSTLTISTDDCANSCFFCQYETDNCHYGSHINLSDANIKEQVLKKCLHKRDIECTSTCFDGSDICENVTGTNPILQLYMLSVFATLIFIALGSITSLTDAACYNALGDQPQNFGKQRLWGTVGWGTFGLLVGYLNQVFTGTSKVYNYSSGFYILIILFAIDFVVISQLKLKRATISKNIFKDISTLLVQPNIIFFIVTMFVIGVMTGIARFYILWYLRTTLGANQLILGCAVGIQCFLGELPFFYFSGLIIEKLGHANTFTMCLVSYGLKFLGHSFITKPLWGLPVELLRGPCFGSFYSAMTSYSKMIAPKGTEATMQGIVSGTFEGLGVHTAQSGDGETFKLNERAYQTKRLFKSFILQ